MSPLYVPTPLDDFIGPFHPGIVAAIGALSGANRGVFASFTVLRRITITTAVVRIGVQSGNIDIGVYSTSGTNLNRLSSTGSTACPAVANRVTIALTASVALVPGARYWAGIAADNTSVTWGRMANFGAGNFLTIGGQISSVFPLVSVVDATGFFDSALPVVNFE